MIEVRACKVCEEVKNINDFHKSGRNDSRKRTCKDCLNSESRSDPSLSIGEMIDLHKLKFNMGYPMYMTSHDYGL